MSRYEEATAIILRAMFVAWLILMFTYPVVEPQLTYIRVHLLNQAGESPVSAVCAVAVLIFLVGAVIQALASRARSASLMGVTRAVRLQLAAAKQNKERLRPRWELPATRVFLGLAAAVSLLWLLNVSFAQPGDSGHQDRTTFMITLWPVHTAVFSVAAAITVFVLQSASARVGVNLLTYFLRYPEIKATLVTGILGFVSISFAVLLPSVGLQIPIVAVLFNLALTGGHVLSVIGTLRLISTRALHTARAKWIDEVVTASVEHEVENRMAVQGLETAGMIPGVQFSLWSSPPKDYLPVRSRVTGRVLDLDIGALTNIANQLVTAPGELHLIAYPGRYVQVGDPLLYVPQGTEIDLVMDPIASMFSIETEPEDGSPNLQLKSVLEQLREGAYQALATRNPAAFGQAMDGYFEIFSSVHRALDRYNEANILPGSLFDWYPREVAFRDWSMMLEKAVASGEVAFVREAIRRPVHLLEAFMEAGDHYNFGRTARLYVMMYSTGAEEASGAVAEVATTGWEQLFSFSTDHIEKRLSDPLLPAPEYQRFAAYLWSLLDVVCFIGRRAIDVADVRTVKHICSYLDTFDEWRPTEWRPHPFEVEYVREKYGDESFIHTQLLTQADSKAAAEVVKETSTTVISAIRFLWCAWATDRVARGQIKHAEWLHFVDAAATPWGSLDKLSHAGSFVEAPAARQLLKWEFWETEKSFSLLGRVTITDETSMNMEERILLFYSMYGSNLFFADTSAGPTYAPFMERLVPFLDGLIQSGLPEPWRSARVGCLTSFREAINQLVERKKWDRENEVISSPLSVELIQEIQDGVRRRWGEMEYQRKVAEVFGSVVIDRTSRTKPRGSLEVGCSISIEKKYLAALESGLPPETISEQLWRGALHNEYAALLDSLVKSASRQVPVASWVTDLSHQLQSSTAGSAVAAIFGSFRFERDIARHDPNGILGWVPKWKDESPSDLVQYMGRLGSVPVFLGLSQPDELLIVRRNAVTLRLIGPGHDGGPRFAARVVPATAQLLEWIGIPSEEVCEARKRLLGIQLRTTWFVDVTVSPAGTIRLKLR